MSNLLTATRSSAIFGIAALGITLAMIAGAVDISFGAIISVGGIVAATLVARGQHLPIVIAAVLLTGACLGAVNALLVSALRLDAIIVTLGTLSVFGGGAYVYTHGVQILAPSQEFASLGRGYLLGVPSQVLLLIGIAIALAALLRYSVFAQTCYVVGDNPRAAGLAGINVSKIRALALILSGLTAATAGMMNAANAGIAFPGVGEVYLLPGLAAVVVGGTALSGGSGTILGTLIGILILATIDNALDLLGVQTYYQDVFRGAILIAALIVNALRLRTG
ncbi:MAG: ABC transporter permease [Aggregatilineales bacterium]